MTKEEAINTIIASGCKTNEISDGYHTFEQLYEHRIVLYIALCNMIGTGNIWKSKKHSDGTEWDGWFLLGIDTRQGRQITYHLPISKWDQCQFQELSQAPPFDGHSSEDVLNRISKL
jgi:hypothetical protein